MDREPGDVQFDEESGEGDTLAVERDFDLARAAQARQTIEEIDAALERITKGVYGICEYSGESIPKERLKAIPVGTRAGGVQDPQLPLTPAVAVADEDEVIAQPVRRARSRAEARPAVVASAAAPMVDHPHHRRDRGRGRPGLEVAGAREPHRRRSGRPVLDPALQPDVQHRDGVLEGLQTRGRSSRWSHSAIVLVLLFIARRIESKVQLVLIGVVVGGALGNLVDRLFRAESGFLTGGVVDFIDPQFWPVFNVADACVVVGGILLAITGLRQPEPDEPEER